MKELLDLFMLLMILKMWIKNVNNFTWWIWNSEYIWKPWSYASWLNVDVYDWKWLQLWIWWWYATTVNTRNQWQIIWAVYAPSRANKIFATVDWYIEVALDSSKSFQFKDRIFNILTKQIWWQVFWIILSVDWGVYKWTVDYSAVDLWVWDNWDNITQEWTLPDVDWNTSYFFSKCPYVINSDLIYVTGWNNFNNDIFTVDTTTSPWTITNPLKLDDWFNVTYMWLIWSSVHIVWYDWWWWKEVYWDWISDTLSSSKTYWNRFIWWYWKPIEWWATFQNSNYYVINEDLYLSQGYNAQRLYKNKDFKVWINNALETIWEHLYVPWQFKVYKYWQPTVWLPHNLSATRINGNISYMEHHFDFLDVFYTDYTDNNKKYISIWKDRYNNNYWTLYSYKFDLWQYWAKKNLVKCRIWYNIPSWTWADIYVKYDNDTKNATFYTTWTLEYITPPSVWDIYSFNNIDYTITSAIRRIDSNWNTTTQWLIINWVSTTPSNITDYDYWHWLSLNKVSWNWEASYQIDKADYWFQLLKELDNTKTTDTIMIRDSMPVSDFNEIQVKIDMWTVYDNLTPTIYDYTLEYNIIENDFWW